MAERSSMARPALRGLVTQSRLPMSIGLPIRSPTYRRAPKSSARPGAGASSDHLSPAEPRSRKGPCDNGRDKPVTSSQVWSFRTSVAVIKEAPGSGNSRWRDRPANTLGVRYPEADPLAQIGYLLTALPFARRSEVKPRW